MNEYRDTWWQFIALILLLATLVLLYIVFAP